MRAAYEGELAEDLNDIVGDLGGESLVLAKAIDVVRTLGQELQGLLNNVLEGIILHLDDVFAGNRMASAGLEHRGTKCQRQDCGEDEFETHFERLKNEVAWGLEEGLLLMGRELMVEPGVLGGHEGDFLYVLWVCHSIGVKVNIEGERQTFQFGLVQAKCKPRAPTSIPIDGREACGSTWATGD